MTGRNRIDGVKTRGGSRPGISSGGALETGPRGTRPEGGVKPDQALVRNGRTCRLDAKGDVRAGSPRKDQRTDARHRGGAARSRVEGPVTLQLRLRELDRAAPVERLGGGLVCPSPEGPVQDEGRRRRGTAEREPDDQAADLGHAERYQEPADGSPPLFAGFSMARRPARKASASMARVTCRCQPRQLRTS